MHSISGIRLDRLSTITVVVLVGFCAPCHDVRGGERVDKKPSQSQLKISVDDPIVLSPKPGHTSGVLAVSRTGTVAAFYECETPGHHLHPEGARASVYKISDDRGQTWGPERLFPPKVAGGAMFTALSAGGVLKMAGQAKPVAQSEGDELEAKRILFTDDFLQYEIGTAKVFLPDPIMHTKWAKFYPVFDKGKIVALPGGDLLATMYGNLKGDTQYRTLLVRSNDKGHTWRYHATVAYDPSDPDPQLPGEYCGYCEPSLALLANSKLLCMMRTQGTHHPPDYRPMYVSWSSDLGMTWSKPTLTHPHLKNVWPTITTLDDGVVACIYGRPGVHVSFSTDEGRTWGDRVTFTDLPTASPTGESISAYADMVKVGPNKLLAIAAVGPGGTRVFPITVDRR